MHDTFINLLFSKLSKRQAYPNVWDWLKRTLFLSRSLPSFLDINNIRYIFSCFLVLNSLYAGTFLHFIQLSTLLFSFNHEFVFSPSFAALKIKTQTYHTRRLLSNVVVTGQMYFLATCMVSIIHLVISPHFSDYFFFVCFVFIAFRSLSLCMCSTNHIYLIAHVHVIIHTSVTCNGAQLQH